MTIQERHVTEENTLQKKSEPPIYFPKPPPPKVNRRFTFLYFFCCWNLPLISYNPVCRTARATPCLLKSDTYLHTMRDLQSPVWPIQTIPPKCFPKHLPWAWSHPFLEPPCRHDSSLPDPQVGCACGLSHRPPQCPPRSHHNTGTAGQLLFFWEILCTTVSTHCHCCNF